MGIIQSICCNDTQSSDSNDSNEAQEEQSRIWAGNPVNQYGSCILPSPPIVYRIVLPKLAPISIDTTGPVISASSKPVAAVSLHHFSNDHSSSTCSVASQAQLTTEIKEEYCPDEFHNIRSQIFEKPQVEEQFKELLLSCSPWSAPGGKSGSTFLKTTNDQFILKEMSKLELQSFLSIADEYFNYIRLSYEEQKPSLLSTILGVYRIIYTNCATQASSESFFMVMRNLFFKRNISQMFDLKGSMRNRLVNTNDPDNNEHVLMDENLLRITCDDPLYIHASTKSLLNEALDSDSKFLTSISVMDYSLLVGVDKENQELILGIIDYVRPFTWDKKIERVVKSVVSTELPTIIEPELYRERFCEAMDKYFEVLPDHW